MSGGTAPNTSVSIECPNFGETPTSGNSPIELCKNLHKVNNQESENQKYDPDGVNIPGNASINTEGFTNPDSWRRIIIIMTIFILLLASAFIIFGGVTRNTRSGLFPLVIFMAIIIAIFYTFRKNMNINPF